MSCRFHLGSLFIGAPLRCAGLRREEFLFKRPFDGTAEAGALIPSEAKAKRSKEQKQEAKSRSERNGIKKQEKRNQEATRSERPLSLIYQLIFQGLKPNRFGRLTARLKPVP
jgi:hypothetical protein